MNETIALTLAFFAGAALGAFFFGGLWWTVNKGLVSGRPALWFVASMLLRGGVAVAGFIFVAASDWRRLLACLLGFVLARVVMNRVARLPPASSANGKAFSHGP